MMEQWRSALFDTPRLRRMRFKETPQEELEWLVLTEDLALRHQAKLISAGASPTLFAAAEAAVQRRIDLRTPAKIAEWAHNLAASAVGADD